MRGWVGDGLMVRTMWNFELEALKVWREDSRVGRSDRRAGRREDISDMVGDVVVGAWARTGAGKWDGELSQVEACGGDT